MNNSLFLALILSLIISNTLLGQSNFDYYKNRTFDGTFNDLRNNDEGKAGIPFVREAKAQYAGDGSTMIDGPNPRELSNLLCNQDSDAENKYGLSSMVFTFLQFIDHDITETEGGGEFVPIIVPKGDPQFDPFQTGYVIIPFSRSAIEVGTGTSSDNPRAQRNLITAWLDGSGVYGSDEERAKWLRSGECGKLKVYKSDYSDLLPCNTRDGDCNGTPDENAPAMAMNRDHSGKLLTVFVAGDVRANEQPGLTALHTLFVREHNRICDELTKKGSCSDEINYQYPRKVVGGLIQSILYNELIPKLGLKVGSENYRRNLSPEITNTFAASAYRLGHTMISEFIPIIENECGDVDKELSLAEAFFNPSIIQNGGIDGILRGLNRQVQQEVDPKLVSAVRSFLFGPPGAGGLDLAALNIQRARDHGIPDYNTLREEVGLKKVTTFGQISSYGDIQEKLEKAYGDVGHIDSWAGMLCEDHVPGSPFGKTISKILSKQFKNIRKADRLYYSRDRALSRSVRYEISRTSLADVIKRNTGVENMQDAFYKGKCDGGEELVYCDMKAQNSKYEWIGLVGVNGHIHESTKEDGYSDFTDVVMPMHAGNNKIALGSGYNFLPFTKMWNVWIDLNKNGRFEDNELRLSKISRMPIEALIKIPSDVEVSQARMRVIMSLFRTKDPCVDIYYGEVEDYTVSFGDEVDDLADLAKTIDSEIPSVELVAYPNPAADYISFKGIQLDNVNEKYLIINTLGQEVAGGHTSELVKGLRVSEWNSGAYFMHVMQQSGESKSLGFIVKR